MNFAKTKSFKVCCLLFICLVLMAQQGVNVINSTIAVTQSGTWTVQPGNTANSTAWLVTGTGGTFPVTGTFWQATQPISTADGSSVTLGAKADAKSTATDTTAITVMQVLKEISAMEQAPASRAVTNAGTFATQDSTTQTNTSNTATNVSTLDSDLKADPCGPAHAKSYAFYDASTSGATQLVALSSGKVVYVCSYSFSSSSSTANTLKLVYGTGSNCATGQTAMTPGIVLQAATSTGPIGKMNSNSAGLQTIASNALCLLTNAAQAAQAEVSYVQQ